MKSIKFDDGFEIVIFGRGAKPGGWIYFPVSGTGRWESRASIAEFLIRRRRVARRMRG